MLRNLFSKILIQNKVLRQISRVLNIVNLFSEFILRRISISRRLFVTFILISIIPLMTVGITSIKLSTSSMQQNIGNYSSQIINQLSENLINETSKYESISYDVINSKEMSDYIDVLSSDDKSKIFSHLKDITILLSNKTESLKSIDGIYFYTAEYIAKTKIQNSNIKMTIDSSNLDPIWAYTGDVVTDYTTYHINGPVLYRKVISGKTSKFVGVLVVAPKGNTFTNLISGLDLGKQQEIDILNTNNIIISSTNKDLIGKPNLVFKEKEKTSAVKGKYSILNISGEKMLVCTNIMNSLGWSVQSFVPFDNLMEKINIIIKIIIIICFICVFLAILFSYLVTKSVTYPINKIRDSVERLSCGDFSEKLDIRYKDEITLLSLDFNSMIDNIRNMIQEVDEATENVNKRSEDISNNSRITEDIAKQVTEAISAMSENSSQQTLEACNSKEKMNSLASKINCVTDSSMEMMNIAENTKEISNESLVIVGDLKEKANETSQMMITISKEIRELSNNTEQITGITKLITNIADNTNLLSLNAQIEAARAGQAGKGFAVVAEEIKKLANQSKKSALDISKLINEILIKVEKVVCITNNASNSIQREMNTVFETDRIFNQFSEANRKIVHQIQDVNLMMQQMKEHKDDAIKSMEVISEILEQSAVANQEISASTEKQLASSVRLSDLGQNLMEMSTKLKNSINKFKV